MLGRGAEGPADPPHGGPADGEAFDLPELLGGVAVIDVAVDGLQQRRHPGAQRARQGPGGRLAAAAVEQAAQFLCPIPGLDPLELPDGQRGTRRACWLVICPPRPASSARAVAPLFGSFGNVSHVFMG